MTIQWQPMWWEKKTEEISMKKSNMKKQPMKSSQYGVIMCNDVMEKADNND